jgi:hypothetical protein
MGPNKWPSVPADFRTVSESYIEQVESLGNSVMKAIAMGLDVDEELFLKRIDKAFWNLRILGYEGRKSKNEGKAGIGEHTGMKANYIYKPSRYVESANRMPSRFRDSHISTGGLEQKVATGAGQVRGMDLGRPYRGKSRQSRGTHVVARVKGIRAALFAILATCCQSGLIMLISRLYIGFATTQIHSVFRFPSSSIQIGMHISLPCSRRQKAKWLQKVEAFGTKTLLFDRWRSRYGETPL